MAECRCENCIYFDARSKFVFYDDEHPCRRYPPTKGAWARVCKEDWCGEFREKKVVRQFEPQSGTMATGWDL